MTGRARSFVDRLRRREAPTTGERVLILTPVKDAANSLEGYFRLLFTLTFPHDRLSLGMLESDSRDETYAKLQRALPVLRKEFRGARLWKHDFGLQTPRSFPRTHPSLQVERRTVLAMSRNHLLFRALDDEDWVLWLDVDLASYPPDLIERLLATGKEIVHPHCVLQPGGPTFDRNAWRDHGRLHLDDLRGEGEVTPLDTVGGTALFVRADRHRDGLIFPPFPYGRGNAKIRADMPEIETEGFGIMAGDMGLTCWGMPHLEVIHGPR